MGDIQIVAIDEELKKLHKAQADKKGTQASLFTLIVYVDEEQRAEYLQGIIQSIIEKYPCRIIFIHLDKTPSSDHLRVHVSSVQNDKSGTLVACDQINIEVGFKKSNRIIFLILPHILPDLPVYLLWGQDATTCNDTLSGLEKLADRLIFDAECTKDLKRFCLAILEKKKKLDTDLIDTNWALCGGWRDIITQAFNLEEHLEQLARSKQIVILYNNSTNKWVQQPEMQSIYIQGWIAARLKWEFKKMTADGANRAFTYSTLYGNVEVILTGRPVEKILPGSVFSFEVFSNQGYHFQLELDQKFSKVILNCSSPNLCELPTVLPLMDIRRGFTFMNEIFYSPSSQYYIEALELLSHIE